MYNKNKSNQKQQWTTAKDCLEDHVEVWTRLPRILGAYIGPHKIPAKLSESIMVAVNSKNNCPYCEGLHGQLARMAGVDDHKQLQAAKTVEDCTSLVNDPAVAFARTFANNREEELPLAYKYAYQKVVQAHGQDKAKSVEALCWFLAWGSQGGNTVNGTLWEGQRGVFPMVFTLYYAPLFGVIAVMNKVLALMPKNMPGVFFQGMGVTLTVAGGTWMTPVGLLGLSRRMMVG